MQAVTFLIGVCLLTIACDSVGSSTEPNAVSYTPTVALPTPTSVIHIPAPTTSLPTPNAEYSRYNVLLVAEQLSRQLIFLTEELVQDEGLNRTKCRQKVAYDTTSSDQILFMVLCEADNHPSTLPKYLQITAVYYNETRSSITLLLSPGLREHGTNSLYDCIHYLSDPTNPDCEMHTGLTWEEVIGAFFWQTQLFEEFSGD